VYKVIDIKDIPTSVNYLPSKETKYIEGKVVVILGIEVYNDTD
jgi:hypothetical protein